MSAAPAASPLSLDDPRLGDYIRTVTLEQFPEAIKSSSSTASPSSARLHVAFTGFPYDEGCRRNGGRVGAEDGPEVVRKFGQ
jgi:arginase family enzyme